MTEQELGIYGEDLAVNLLVEKGYRIRTRNYRFNKNEIDIVAEHEDKIIVVEVKTRQTAEIGEPWMAVTRKKQRVIIACADHYVKEEELDTDVRFDIVSIVHNSFRTTIEHIEDAFST